MAKLTTTQHRALAELAAACREHEHYWPSGTGWVRSADLCGTPSERSSTTLKGLVEAGLAEGKKPIGSKQTQWSWRVTEAGLAALAQEDGR